MKLYALIHIYHGGLIEGGVQLSISTNRADMEDEMYRQLDKTWGMMDQDYHHSEYAEALGYAYIGHYDGMSPEPIYDHEWRIVTL